MDWVRDLVGRYSSKSSPHAYRECRHCGRTFENLPSECSACGSEEFSIYTIR